MKSALVFAVLSGFFWLVAHPVFADTGTYEILEYRLELAPQDDGRVRVAYYQKWKVTGGHIPWITVGCANSRFSIMSSATKGNVDTIRDNSAGSWSGVKITLDRDYQPEETFEVWFAVMQKGLFYREKGDYCLTFTPGWYDRARIGLLSLEVVSSKDLSEVSARPSPDQVETHRLLWEREDLRPGGKVSIKVSFPTKFFPKELRIDKPKPASKGDARDSHMQMVFLGLFIGFIVLMVLIILVIKGKMGSNRYGKGGSVGWGGTHFHGTGCVVSCACACVACACACACAGGGAAGCDRKLTRTCPLCKTCDRTDCPLYGGR